MIALLGLAGSSPHTRGALVAPEVDELTPRIIPAYAGSTSTVPIALIATADHPRIRGEHFLSHPFSVSSTGSSPHTRGALVAPEVDELTPRIIPAYAGSTSASFGRYRVRPDHPRIRGEHPTISRCR